MAEDGQDLRAAAIATVERSRDKLVLPLEVLRRQRDGRPVDPRERASAVAAVEQAFELLQQLADAVGEDKAVDQLARIRALVEKENRHYSHARYVQCRELLKILDER